MAKTPSDQRYWNPPDINVTPLIDVLLVLLIIFMVITPLKPHHLRRSGKQSLWTFTTHLSHPNVCVIHDVGEMEDGRPFIVMEYALVVCRINSARNSLRD